MLSKATSLARELKAVKSELGFMQERCVLLEEENRRLRYGGERGPRPDEEDDLVSVLIFFRNKNLITPIAETHFGQLFIKKNHLKEPSYHIDINPRIIYETVHDML